MRARKRRRNRPSVKQFPGGPYRQRQQSGQGGFSRQVVRRHAHKMLVNTSRMLQPFRGRGAPSPKQMREEQLGKIGGYPQGQRHQSSHTKPTLISRRDRNRRRNKAARRARRASR